MAKKKKTAPRRAPRRTGGKKSRSRRRSGGGARTMQASLMEVVKGVAGAAIMTRVADMVPIADPRMRYGALTLASVFVAMKMPAARSFALGAGVSAGTRLAVEFMPTLLTAGSGGGGATMVNGIGRLSPEMQARIHRAADDIRGQIGGMRESGIMGPRESGIMGTADFYPQPLTGSNRQGGVMGGGGGYDNSVSY